MTTMTELDTKMIPLKDIKVTGNIRKHFDESDMKDITQSIREHGVVQPVLVRPKGAGYELIAGERRIRGSKAAGKTEIPARILDVDDAKAAELQALENIQRKDLTPIEEAQAFKQLMETAKWRAEDVADKIHKSKVHVYRLIRLLELPVKMIEAIDAGTMTAAHGHQILRAADKKAQERLVTYCLREKPTVAELKEQVEEQVGRSLSKAPFPKDVPYADKPACAQCPFNSGNQGDMFEGTEKGKCTGSSCYDHKVKTFIDSIVAENNMKNPKMKFLGVYQQEHDIRRPDGVSIQQVPMSGPVRSMMAKDPEKFYWAVAQDWNDGWKIFHYAARTPAVMKALGQSSSSSSGSTPSAVQRNGEYASRTEAIQDLMKAGVRRVFWEKSAKMPTAKDLLAVIQEDEIDGICQVLQLNIKDVLAWPVEKLVKLLWFSRTTELQNPKDDSWMEGDKALKAAAKNIEKDLRAAADKVWKKLEVPACQVCGCTNNKSCEMVKDEFRPCWWVRPGICSACKDKPVPAVKPAAKPKGKVK